jgi:hypothetical protein
MTAAPRPSPPPRHPPRQINGDYKCRDAKLQPLLREVLRLLDKFESAELRHVYRWAGAGGRRAGRAARGARAVAEIPFGHNAAALQRQAPTLSLTCRAHPNPPRCREDNQAADELANLAVDVDQAIDELGAWTARGGARAGDRSRAVALLARNMQIEGRCGRRGALHSALLPPWSTTHHAPHHTPDTTHHTPHTTPVTRAVTTRPSCWRRRCCLIAPRACWRA